MRRAAFTDEILRAAYADVAALGNLPRYRILYEAIRQAILSQQLVPGVRLSSTRELAGDLGLSRNTVLSTFEALLAEGYIVARAGSGTYVAHSAAAPKGRARRPSEGARAASVSARSGPEELSRRGLRLARFQGGRRLEILPMCGPEADFTLFPMKQWQRLQSRQLRQGHLELLDYATQGGFAPLRRAIADYLRTSRAVRVEVEQVVLTAGTQHSLDLCAQLLADVGDAVWMEEPGYWGARCIFEACDLRVEPVPVDGEGMNPDLAPRGSRPRLIYLTPSNQYPTGVAMSLARRRALLQIAARERAWIIEDDYDSELRYSGRPLASLQGLDAGQRVVYVGTFSKVLFPGIKIGYMVVPAPLAEPFRSALYDLQRPGQLTVQAALADFIERGYFVTHIRRLRQAYAERREVLVGALGLQPGKGAQITSQAAGLHLVVGLPDGLRRPGAGGLGFRAGYHGARALAVLHRPGRCARAGGRIRICAARQARPPRAATGTVSAGCAQALSRAKSGRQPGLVGARSGAKWSKPGAQVGPDERGRRQAGDLRAVVRGGDFDTVHPDPVQIGEALEQREYLVGRQSADLRRSGAGRAGRIQAVDVQRQVDGRRVPATDSSAYLADQARQLLRAFPAAQLARGDGATACPLHEVARVGGGGRADADLHRRARVHQALQDRFAHPGAMAGRLTLVIAPGVAMRIQMHDRQRPRRDRAMRAQDRQCDRMVASQPAHVPGRHQLLGGRLQRDAVLLERGRRQRQIPEIDQRLARRAAELRVGRVAQHAAGGANRAGSEARTRPVGDRAVKRHADHREARSRCRCIGARSAEERRVGRVGDHSVLAIESPCVRC